MTALVHVACRDYHAHQSQHRLIGDHWVCEVCKDKRKRRTACECRVCMAAREAAVEISTAAPRVAPR
jgi:hypothetical protein